MAPSAIDTTHSNAGAILDEVSDNIDAVNILKGQMKTSTFDADKDKAQFRQYEKASAKVTAFYREQQSKQTVSYNLWSRNEFKSKVRARMTVWEAMEKLNTFQDNSDPDTQLTQIEHLLQTAEAMRRDNKPRWMQVTGLIHDLGKLWDFFRDDKKQWDVVGDTFPVGCAFEKDKITSSGGRDNFIYNPDSKDPIYSTKNGIYSPGCGIDNIMLSWGHDEYLYLVVKDQSVLPAEALAMIRYHSFYPWHREGAYAHFMNDHDKEMLKSVLDFNPYDLYSKSDGVPNVEGLKVCHTSFITFDFC